MKRLLLILSLTLSISAAAQAQTVMIEGTVYPGVEGGCWGLRDVRTGRPHELYGGVPDLYQDGVWATVWGYPRDWYTICMQGIPFEVVEFRIGPWWWPPQQCRIVPEEPTTIDAVTITLGGEWPDSCVPNGSSVSVVGGTIQFNVIHNYPSGTACLQVITPWSRTETVGLLAAGTYTVSATLYEWGIPVAGPAAACAFHVTPAGHVDFSACMTGPGGGLLSGCAVMDADADEDVDLRDFQTFQVNFSDTSPRIGGYSHSDCRHRSDTRTADYPDCGEDQVVLTPEPGSLHVLHQNATYNCCPDDIAVTLAVTGKVLRLTEHEMLTMPCFCLCCYDVEATVVDLAPGPYTIEYCWADYETGDLKCYVDDVTVRQ